MARVKTARTTRARHKKVLKQAKGYFGSKHRLYKTAKEQLMHSGQYAFRDRKQKKREFRKLWITRINAACRQNDISYSRFINGLSKAEISINRKMLSELAVSNPTAFAGLVELSKAALEGKTVEVKPTKKVAAVKEVKEVKKAVPAKAESVDLSSIKVAELRVLAKEKAITGYSTMKKADLLEALK